MHLIVLAGIWLIALPALVWARSVLYAVGVRKRMWMRRDKESAHVFIAFRSIGLLLFAGLVGLQAALVLAIFVPACMTLVLAIKVATYKKPKRVSSMEELRELLTAW